MESNTVYSARRLVGLEEGARYEESGGLVEGRLTQNEDVPHCRKRLGVRRGCPKYEGS